MANLSKPFEAYQGNDDYIFVSYAHSDAQSVYPDFTYLKDAGFNIWYDEGISPGSRWTSELASAIENCSLFLAFVSPAAVESENCVNEIEFAINRRRPMLVVQLEETSLPSGLELSLGGRQMIPKSELEVGIYQQRLSEGANKLIDGEDPYIGATAAIGKSRRWGWVAVATIVVLTATLAVRQFSGFFSTDSDLRLAIAVRPFDIKTTDPDSEFFAEGLADDLIMRLGHWRNLPVIARGSSFAEDLPAEPMAAGAALNARYIVEGSGRVDGGQIKLAVFLIDASTGQNVWSTEIESTWDTALSFQADISDSIVAKINPALVSAESRRAVRSDPSNLDAWTAAMRGWWHLNTETREGLAQAQIWFTKAAELDPTWSWPHSAQSLAGYRSIINSWAANMRQVAGGVIQSAQTAVQVDPLDAFAHHALGHAYAIMGQIDESLGALARGVELSPNDAMANGCYAMQLAASNRPEEAKNYIDHAMSISPEDPWQHRFALVRARAHFAAAEYEESENWATRSLQLRPNNGAFLHSVAAPALSDGIDRARERVNKAREVQPTVPLEAIEQSFLRNTDRDYVTRLIEGLKRAGFE